MTRHTRGIRLVRPDGTLDLSWYGDDILRCRFWREREPALDSLYLTASPCAPADWTAETDAAGNVVLRSAQLVAHVDRATAAVRYTTPDGRELLAEHAGSRALPPHDYPRPEDRHGAAISFRVDERQPLIGCGQLRDGRVDRRHSSALLVQTNHEAVLPVMLSPAGWALLWHNASATTFRHDGAGMHWESRVADGVDYFVGHANGERLVAICHRLTGLPPLPPRWALGFFQSKERYKTATEVREVAREFRRRGLPLDCIVQDWAYWGRWAETHKWSYMRYDPDAYGDLPGLIRALHEEDHVRLLISIWPALGIGSDIERELTALGATFDPAPGHWQGDGKVKIYDAFRPRAREVYWRYAHDGLWRHGVDAWWMDATEPELVNSFDGRDQAAVADALPDTAAGSWARHLNGYATAHVRGVYEGQRAADPRKRIFILTRSAFLGSQAYGAATWSGDIAATWRMLAEQVAAGISATASGIPWWTTDCGAFFLGPGMGGHFAPDPSACDDPAYRELYLRWFQFEAFSPLMRSHGTQAPREPWRFGEPGTVFYDGLLDMLRLRYRLLPYVESEAARVTRDGGTLLRPLALEFPGDPDSAALADQFLFGPSLMACPVTRPFRHAPAETTEVVDYSLMLNDRGRRRWTVRLEAVPSPDRPASPLTVVTPPYVDFVWPADKTPASAVCETCFTPRADGEHIFAIRVAGGVRLLLDGHTLVEDWTGPAGRECRAAVTLKAGAPHALRVEYRHTEGEGRLRLGLIEPGRPELRWNMPATEESRTAWLPPGLWWDFWTGERLAGGRHVTLAAPLHRLPVLARAGGILPLGPHRQWTDEKPADPIELRVYPGADGSFTLYEDAGDGYGYERGECARIPLRWDDARQRLAIGPRSGRFPGMLEQRAFHVTVVRPGHGTGIEPTTTPDRTVHYDGRPQES